MRRVERVEVPCATCGTIMFKRPGDPKRGHYYCARACYWGRTLAGKEQEVVRMYVEEGRTCEEIGRIVGFPCGAVYNALRRLGVPRRVAKPPAREATQAVVRKVVRLRRHEGLQPPQIADAVGISVPLVNTILRKHFRGIAEHGTVNREELAWAAGFFDGEGHVRCAVDGRSGGLALGIKQIDPRPLQRFRAAVFGIGIVHGPYQPGAKNWHPIYEYRASGTQKIIAIVAALWPFLCEPKRRQFTGAFRVWRTHVRGVDRTRETCRRGHYFAVVGRTTHGACSACRAEYLPEYWKRRRREIKARRLEERT